MSTKGLKTSSASKSQDGSPKVPPRIKIPSVSVELSDNDDAQQNDATSPKSGNQYNFMHDPSTVLRPEDGNRVSTQQGGNSPSGLSPSSGGLAPPSPSSDPDGNGHRKVSLMPLVTEEDLRSRPDLGRHDPQSVAELFGEDFASQLCVVRAASAIMMNSGSSSPLPYDPKEKMVRNLSGFGPIGPESARLPFEIRDNNLPEGVPTVKVRRKPMSLVLHQQGSQSATDPGSPAAASDSPPPTGAYEEVGVALSPVAPKFPSLPSSMFASPLEGISDQTAGGTASNTISFPFTGRTTQRNVHWADGMASDGLDIAASNPDMVHFQQVLNDWIKKQTKVLGSAFILVSSDINSTYCQVCGNVLLDEPIQCGDSELLVNIFKSQIAKEAFNMSAASANNNNEGQNEKAAACDDPSNDECPPVIDVHKLLLSSSTEPAVKQQPFSLLSNFQRILQRLSARRASCSPSVSSSPPTSSCSSPPACTITKNPLCTASVPHEKPANEGIFSGYKSQKEGTAAPPEGLAPQQSGSHFFPSGQNDADGRQIGLGLKQEEERTTTTPKTSVGSGSRTPGLPQPPASLIGIRARCGFVAGLLLSHSSQQNKQEELCSVLPHIPMIATLMSIVDNVEEQKRLARQSQVFLSMTQNVFSSLQDMNLLVRNITKEAKALVQAEICSLFLLDKEHSELVAEVFEKNGTSDEYLTEIRMPLTQGIVGHVATTGQMMNVKDVYNHPYFYPKVDERTGFVTRNILCFPIKDSQGNLVGVAELCNKIGKSSFTKHDEQIATTFAVYCAISISHCLLYRKLQEAHRRSHMAAELLVQGSTLSIAPEDILRLTVRDIPAPTSFHPEFNGFHFVPRSIGTGDTYVEASLSMFKDLGFIDKYRLRRRTLARFLLMVQKGYRDVPYHNWSHAFAVGHFCYLLVRMPAVKQALSELERFALLVACLCHDIDHRGTTNAFQLQSKTPLAQLYSSEGSVLERHHFAQTVTILGMDECNIFEQLTRQQYQIVLDSIREIILATDIAAHLRKVQRIKQMVDDGYDASMPDHHYLFMCLLMTASDLSDQSKDFRNSKAIAENIYKEFFSQGDLEKQMGNRPIEMMDRERACVPKIQLEFMDTVALPVFDYLSQMLPDLSSTYESIVTNRCCWSTLDDILQEEGLASQGLGLEYLRNSELERRVLERIRQERPPQFGRNQLQSPSEKGPFGETSSSPGSPVTQTSGIFSTAERDESHQGEDVGSPTSSPSKRPKPHPEHTIHEKLAQ